MTIDDLNYVLDRILWAIAIALAILLLLSLAATQAQAKTPARANPMATGTYLTLFLQAQGAPVKDVTCKGVGKYVMINKGRSYLSLECVAVGAKAAEGKKVCFKFTPLVFPKYKAKLHPCVTKQDDSSIGLAA